MAVAEFKIDAKDFIDQIKKALSRFADTKACAAEIGESLVTSTKLRFRKETGPDGEKWKESARASEEGGQTLTDDSILKNSIEYEATSTQVAVGTNVKYAKIHQYGGDITPKTKKALKFKVGNKWVTTKKVTMPARPFIGIDDDDVEEARAIMVDFMTKAFSK
ncbi:MAG: phage virion morphogenesis protein [Desulforhopalus sp.]|jgi:phage virion morphogenesis protein|nr:phage virion morphogenesis protein [Desulforhopalus sp.]